MALSSNHHSLEQFQTSPEQACIPRDLLSDSNYKRKPGLLTDTHQPGGHRALQWLPILGPGKCHWTWYCLQFTSFSGPDAGQSLWGQGKEKKTAWATRDKCYTKKHTKTYLLPLKPLCHYCKTTFLQKWSFPSPTQDPPWLWVPCNNSYYWFGAYYVPATVLSSYAYYLIESSTPSPETDGQMLQTKNLRQRG